VGHINEGTEEYVGEGTTLSTRALLLLSFSSTTPKIVSPSRYALLGNVNTATLIPSLLTSYEAESKYLALQVRDSNRDNMHLSLDSWSEFPQLLGNLRVPPRLPSLGLSNAHHQPGLGVRVSLIHSVSRNDFHFPLCTVVAHLTRRFCLVKN